MSTRDVPTALSNAIDVRSACTQPCYQAVESRASAEGLLEALRARDELTLKRRDQEPDWSLLTRNLCLDAKAEASLVMELGCVWFLPFIHLESAVNLLVFQHWRIPALGHEFQRNDDVHGRR